MIKSCKIGYENNYSDVSIHHINQFKYLLDLPQTNDCFCLIIEFSEAIDKFKNHDYQWINLSKQLTSSSYSPLLLKFKSGIYLQSTQLIGNWQIDSKRPNVLQWEFNPKFSRPLGKYETTNNFKKIIDSRLKVTPKTVGLLISPHGGIELSRSKIPFSGTLCFTDHCDFDNASNLVTQRTYFKKNGVKVTKGIFLSDYSKRSTASWQYQHDEYNEWMKDGHELAYHSLSQSIKSNTEALSDFKKFEAPVDNIGVWIDHGFQPYNFSLYHSLGLNDESYKSVLKAKRIETLWNYLDAGTCTFGVINQLNPNNFTLDKYWNGVKRNGLKQALTAFFKAHFFHYLINEHYILKYKLLVREVKRFSGKKKWGTLIRIFNFGCTLMASLFKTIAIWPISKHKVFPLARYTPIYFKHCINDSELKVFQTLEILDLKLGLSKHNLNLLSQECGICIGHTYFAVPFKYHKGKLLKDNNTINDAIKENFTYLGELIKNKKIWNPTISEMLAYLDHLNRAEFDVDKEGQIYVKSHNTVIYRTTSV